MIAHILPGVAVTYNGEEIGMENGEVTWDQGMDPQACNGDKEDFESNSRDFQRTPYHWDISTSAGFSTNSSTWLPVSSKYLENNLAKQKAGGNKTHYAIYKKLVEYRKTDTLKYGELESAALAKNVLALARFVLQKIFYYNNLM